MSVPYTGHQIEYLWKLASPSGISRRRFLSLLTMGGAAAVLGVHGQSASFAAQTTPAPAQTAGPTPAVGTAPSSATPAPAAAVRLIQKPIPTEFFIPLGSNAEMRFEVMANRGYTMPNSLFFVRDHTQSVIIDPKTWKLSIEGDGIDRPFTLTYDELLKLPTKTIVRYVECAGNGRSFYDTLLKKPAQGGQWHLGAYGIAEWTGVQLSELLGRAGLKKTAVDVMPTGLDSTKVERPMPVSKAMEDDTILAYLMNGDLLPVDHGFPARIIAPGWVGIASIKWVGKITVSQKPLYSDKNTTSYVLIGPDYTPQPPAKGPVLANNVMKSALALPWPATLKAGTQKVVGYAWSPFGKIAKVDVSLDGGKTFQPATLTGQNIERAGTRWEFTFDAKPGEMTITPRATDEKGNVQPDLSQQKWNEQGYIFGAMVPHPVTVTG